MKFRHKFIAILNAKIRTIFIPKFSIFRKDRIASGKCLVIKSGSYYFLFDIFNTSSFISWEKERDDVLREIKNENL